MMNVILWGAYDDVAREMAQTALNRSIGTAAALDAGTGAGNVVVLDSTGRLPSVDGSQLKGLISGGAAAVPAEIALAPASQAGWVALDAGAERFEAATASPTNGHGKNYAYKAENYTEHGSGGALGDNVTIAGINGRYYDKSSANWGWAGFAGLDGGVASGATLYVEVLAVYPTGAVAESGDNRFNFTLRERQSDTEYEIQPIVGGTNTGDVVLADSSPTAWGTRFAAPSTANDTFNKVISLGAHADGDAYLVQLAIPVLETVTEALDFGLNVNATTAESVPVAGVYVGLDAVDAESSGDAGKFLPPGVTSASVVTLRAADPHEPFQTVSLSSNALLHLPPPPKAGEPPRETRLRVELSDGAVLTLPSGPAIREHNAGTAGQLASSGVVHIEQRPGGDVHLIVVEFSQ